MNLGTMVTGDSVYPGSGPRKEVKPYVLLDCIDMCMKITESIFQEIVVMNMILYIN